MIVFYFNVRIRKCLRFKSVCPTVCAKILDEAWQMGSSKLWWVDCIIVTLGDFPLLPWLNTDQAATFVNAGVQFQEENLQTDGSIFPALKIDSHRTECVKY